MKSNEREMFRSTDHFSLLADNQKFGEGPGRKHSKRVEETCWSKWGNQGRFPFDWKIR